MDYIQIYGTRVATLRKMRNIGTVELADKAGITRQTLNAIERGEGANIKIYIALANALGVSPDFLFSGGEITI